MRSAEVRIAALPKPEIEPCGCEHRTFAGRERVDLCEQHAAEKRDRERAEAASRARMARERDAPLLLERSGFFPEFGDATLADFPRHSSPARAWIDGPGRGLLIRGPVGPGKTRLAAAISRELIIAGAKVEARMAGDLVARLRASYSERSTETEEQAVAHFRDVEVLVIDDLGFEGTVSPLVISALHRIVSWRNGYGRRTIVTTNATTAELEATYGRAIVDRMAPWVQIVVDGPSRRARVVGAKRA